MIAVRSERHKDKVEIQNVMDSAVATLRDIYRPTERAMSSKIQIALSCQRLVATTDDRVVGAVQYCLDTQCIKIIGLDVHKDYRQKGVARSLIHQIKKIGIKKKLFLLKLHTIKETGNVGVFKRLGFKVLSERVDDLFESDKFEKLTDVKMIMEIPDK